MRDLLGQKFGRLTAMERVTDAVHPSGKRSVRWLCLCECGNTCVVYAASLTSHHTKSCGCLQREVAIEQTTKHGGRNERLYLVWRNMISRCTNQNDKHYKYYGKRGISVCTDWMDYAVFRTWAYDNGYDPNAPYGVCTIERYDVDGDYCPDNCGWENFTTQANNRNNNRIISFLDETHTLSQWASITGIDRNIISRYVDKGCSIGDIIEKFTEMD